MVVLVLRLFLVACCLLPLVAGAQDTLTLTLDEALDQALSNNYGIRVVRQQQIIAERNVTRGNAGFLPVVSAGASRNYSISDTRQSRADGQVRTFEGARANNWQGDLTLDWTLFDGGAMFIRYEQLAALRQRGIEEARLTVNNTVATVSRAYFDVVVETDRLNAFKEALQLSEARLTLARDRFEVGVTSKLDYLSAQTDFNTDRSALLRQEQRLAAVRAELNRLLAREPATLFRVADTILVDSTLQFANLTNTADTANPLLRTFRTDQQLATYNTRLLRAGQLPVVGANAGYSYSNANTPTNPFTLNNRNTGPLYGLSVRVPLFNGFNQRRLIGNARIGEQIATLNYQQAENDLNTDLLIAWQDYQTSLGLLRLEDDNIGIAQQNAEIALERYRLGVATPVETREAQRNLTLARNRLIDAANAAKRAEIELLRLSGGLVQ